ncbi:MAG: transketolase [Fimbriimonas ginsengisoli]|uniref:Transketolase n=1 Tax=Fimbriimonas ginsengisoli TaxID=1005039 RepID=A0A931LTN2_FIMGI|nr:transketolase [Fimbriimonas ginsengisoli]
MDAVQAANSGHPGLPMGAAAMGFALWTRHLRHNPKNPTWFNRDRFVLSAGHGSMLLYSLLHLTGYDLSLDEIRRFRQWGSQTPGHPERGLTPGVEMTTGPLGQGFATAVGMGIAERFLSATFNRPGHPVVDHFTYVLCSDGDLMEGVSSEAASLAGHLRLGKLIYLYDDNGITIDGSTSMAFTEDVAARFSAYGWHTERLDGMDVDRVDAALARAKDETDRPSLLICKTVIGFGSPHKEGTEKAHGAALGPEEVRLAKERLGIPLEPPFFVPNAALEFFREAVPRGLDLEERWDEVLVAYRRSYPAEAQLFEALCGGQLPYGWADAMPSFTGPTATRKASEAVLNAIAPSLPTLIGGSADLTESNLTSLHAYGQFQPDTPAGRNLAFGVREHAMVAALNGINLHGGCRAFGGTFLIFSDYCRPAIRLAALMECPTILVFTHDSIGLGEDGPTHQPVEHLTSLRAMPNLWVMRPADGNETAVCWQLAIESRETPCALTLTRQAVPALVPPWREDHPVRQGAYVLREAMGGTPDVVLVATGSEVQHAVGAQALLQGEGIGARVVSMPCMELFNLQDDAYRAQVLPAGVPTVSVEAGASLSWHGIAQAHVALDHFGASAPGETVMREFGFTAENVASVALKLLGR